MGFWGEMLWFEALGYDGRFWEVWRVLALAGVGAAIFSAGFTYLVTTGFSERNRRVRHAALVLAALTGVVWGAEN
jgi:hypothetical protein